MKTSHLLPLVVALVGGFFPVLVEARDYGVFKVTATVPVVKVINKDDPNAKLVTKTLTSNDLLNLAMGRALGTPVKATVAEDLVLAAVITYEDAASPLSTLVVYDRTKTGSGGITATVATMSKLTFLNTGGSGSKNSGVGVASGTFTATAAGLGDPAKHAIESGAFSGQGGGGGRHLFSASGPVAPSPTGAATFSGTFKFHYTDSSNLLITWDGIVVKGALKLTAKPVATYQE